MHWSLTVHSACAERSVLIQTLRQEVEDEVCLPIALSLEDLRAWHLCATTLDSFKYSDGLQQFSVSGLLRALKAAHFLLDNKTGRELLHALADVVGQAVEDANRDPSKKDAKSAAEVIQVLQGVPQPAAIHILSTVNHRRRPSSISWPGLVNMLLSMLPRTYHPAIVQACCMCWPEKDAEGRCIIRTDSCGCPPVCSGSTLHDHDSSTRPKHAEEAAPARTATTTAFQLLAAAAPLAGGSLDLAWAPDSLRRLTGAVTSTRSGCDTDDASTSGEELPPAKRMRPGPATGHAVPDGGNGSQEWRMGSGSLRRLQLQFDDEGAALMPSRWCAALAQLVTLRDLRVDIVFCGPVICCGNDGFEFCMPEFTAALLCLPALEQLAFGLYGKDVAHSRSYDPSLLDIMARCTAPLLDTFSKMPQLSHLDLDGCINFYTYSPAARLSDKVTAPVTNAISQLLRLSDLTCLKFAMAVACQPSGWAAAFGHGVSQLPALAILEVDLDVYLDNGPESDELLLGLYVQPGLPALNDLHLSIDRTFQTELAADHPFLRARSPPDATFKHLDSAMGLHHAARLAHMTALSFWGIDLDFREEEDTCDRHALAAVVARMTALQSLSLLSMELRDTGLLALARVLPGLPGLTHLSLADTCAQHTGVFSVLAALAEPGGPGQGSLRSINLSHSCSLPDRKQSRELARLLAQLRGITHLDLSRLELGINSLWEVIKGLQGLAQLRHVNISGNIPLSVSRRAAAAEAELRMEAARAFPEAEFQI